MWNETISTQAQPLIDKYKSKGYSKYGYTVMGFLAFGKHNDGNEEKTIEKFIELLDSTSTEKEFLDEASDYFGL